MTEKEYKWLKRTADFFLPLLDAVIMLLIVFSGHFALPMKIILLIVVLLIGNAIKYEIKKKLLNAKRKQEREAQKQ